MREHVRKTADWTTQADERIMEFLRDSGSHPSSALRHLLNSTAPGIEYSRPHISRRCNTLAEYGLLEKEYQNYKLTTHGEAFLDGELDATTLDPNPDT